MDDFGSTAGLTRIEALDRFGVACLLWNNGQWGTAAETLGITEGMVESMEWTEFNEVYLVRLADMAKRAGITLHLTGPDQ